MGGKIDIIDTYVGDVPPEALDNSVPAKWLAYNAIQCRTPPYDSGEEAARI